MWPFWWHTVYLADKGDIRDSLSRLFDLVDDICNIIENDYQAKQNSIFTHK